MCGNPIKTISTDNWPQLISVSNGLHGFNSFCNLSRLNLKKGGFTPVLSNQKKRNFFIEKSILGWKSTTRKAAFPSDFKFKVEDTLLFFTYVQ